MLYDLKYPPKKRAAVSPLNCRVKTRGIQSDLKMQGWNVPIEIIQETYPVIPDQQIMDRKNTKVSRSLALIKERDLFFNLGLISKREGIGSAATALYY